MLHTPLSGQNPLCHSEPLNFMLQWKDYTSAQPGSAGRHTEEAVPRVAHAHSRLCVRDRLFPCINSLRAGCC